MTQVQPITTPITWRGYDWAPEATVRFADAAGQQLEAPAALALSSGLLDMPTTNPERATFLREWARSGSAVPGSIEAVASPSRTLTGGSHVEERCSK